MPRWTRPTSRPGASSRSICFSLASLFVLLVVAFGLAAVAAVARVLGVARGRMQLLRALLCLLGIGAALLSPGVAVFEAGATLANDGLSAAALVALLLSGACGAAGPLTLGVLVLGLLAGDVAVLAVAFSMAALLNRGADWRMPAAGLACLAVALLLLGWGEGWRFAAIRSVPPGAVAAVVLPVLTLGATLLLAPALGGVAALYLLARLLLDLPGAVTPGWWGVPVLAAALSASFVMARRAAAADDLAAAAIAMGQAMLALCAAGFGVALLARGADLPPLAALGIAGALLGMVAWAVWGGLLMLAIAAVRGATGTTALARLGGLLRRMPTTGLSLLIALASAAALPLTPGFAAVWLLLQGMLAAARSGGTAVLALIAAGLAATGLVVTLLAVAALRMAGLAMLGAPRSARAAVAPDAPGGLRLGMVALAVVALVTGVVPWLAMLIVQPGVRLLAGVPAPAGAWSLGAAEPGLYAAPGVAVLLAVCVAAAGWAARGPGQPVPAWRGGLASDALPQSLALVLWPYWRRWRPAPTGRAVLLGLGFVLALALGWAAR